MSTEPSPNHLESLFHSLHLASSLVILASHRPPAIPATTQPSVRILRLRGPIAVEDAGASRLVDVLEWAEQVARIWRRHGGLKVQELVEESVKSLKKPKSAGAGSQSLPPSEPEQRPFDALLNFLPADIPDKAVLKQAILVTTITRPYLVAVTPMFSPDVLASPQDEKTRSRRWSLFRSSSSALSTPALGDEGSYSYSSSRPATLSRARMSSFGPLSSFSAALSLRSRDSRIVHLLASPPAKLAPGAAYPTQSQIAQTRLARGIEAFLLSFSYPVQPPDFHPNDPDFMRARPYLLPSAALSERVSLPSAIADDDAAAALQSEWSVAELVLCGALDAPSSTDLPLGALSALSNVSRGKLREFEGDLLPQRAWLAGAGEITLRAPARSPSRARVALGRTYSSVGSSSTSLPALPEHAQESPAPTPAEERECPAFPAPPPVSRQQQQLLAARRPSLLASGASYSAAQQQQRPDSPTGSGSSQGHWERERERERERDAQARVGAHGLPTPPESDEASDGGEVSATASDAGLAGAEELRATLRRSTSRARAESDPYPRQHAARSTTSPGAQRTALSASVSAPAPALRVARVGKEKTKRVPAPPALVLNDDEDIDERMTVALPISAPVLLKPAPVARPAPAPGADERRLRRASLAHGGTLKAKTYAPGPPPSAMPPMAIPMQMPRLEKRRSSGWKFWKSSTSIASAA